MNPFFCVVPFRRYQKQYLSPSSPLHAIARAGWRRSPSLPLPTSCIPSRLCVVSSLTTPRQPLYTSATLYKTRDTAPPVYRSQRASNSKQRPFDVPPSSWGDDKVSDMSFHQRPPPPPSRNPPYVESQQSDGYRGGSGWNRGGRSRGFASNHSHRGGRRGGFQGGDSMRRGHHSYRQQHFCDADVMQMRHVSPLTIDVTAAKRVEDFLVQKQQQRNGLSSPPSIPEVQQLNVRNTTLKRCVLELPINGEVVCAIGQSTRAKLARALCYMHADELIHFYTTSEASGEKGTDVKNGDSCTVGSPPLPLQESVLSSLSTAPKRENFNSWDDFADACEVYVQDTATRAQMEAYGRLNVPPSEHPVANRAQELLNSNRRRYNHPQILQQLNESMQEGTNLIQVAKVAPAVFVATLVLDPNTQLKATGVAQTSKEAKKGCAAHALCILQLLHEDEANLLSQTKGSLSAIGTSGKPLNHRTTVLDGVKKHLNPGNKQLFRYYQLLIDAAPMKMEFTRERSADNAHTFICRATISGVSGEGKGLSRSEAEELALDAAMGVLRQRDERLQTLEAFMKEYTHIPPEAIPAASLPPPIAKELRSRLSEIQKRQEHHINEAQQLEMENRQNRPNLEEVAFLSLTQRAIATDPLYSATMLERLQARYSNPTYLSQFHPRRSTLAMAAVEQQVLESIQQHRVTVICGTTGCGKTTQVPQYILDHEIRSGRGGACNILVTQPRRLSSFSVAERIAQERLGTTGGDVGYAVRLDSKPGRHITVCTTGVLLQVLSSDRSLQAVTHLIIDEVHERDINCDVLLALVREILTQNRNLRVVLMSATMQSEMFAQYFGKDTPVIQVDGAVYPVTVRYMEDIARDATADKFHSSMFHAPVDRRRGWKPSSLSSPRSPGHGLGNPPKTDYQLVAYLVHRAVRVDLRGDTRGKSILVFLPGWKELMAAKHAIEVYRGPHAMHSNSHTSPFHIIILHSSVDSAKQRECFQPAPQGKIKVVIATNIAESGITIDDAAVVIDTGLIKTTAWANHTTNRSEVANTSPFFVPLGTQRNAAASEATATAPTPVFSTQLTLGYSSQANGTQRKGRAGRTQGGVCYRLFTREVWDVLPAFPEADIHRVPLTQVLLKLLSLGYEKPKETLQTFLEPPSPINVNASMDLLKGIGAVTDTEQLTALGEYLAKLPCDPRIGKMVVMGAVLNCLDSVLTVAACVDVGPFVTHREVAHEVNKKRYMFSRGSQSDHISYLNAYNAFCANMENEDFARFNFLHVGNLRLISRYKLQYMDILLHSGLISAGEMHQPSLGVSNAGVGEEEAWFGDDDGSFEDIGGGTAAMKSGNGRPKRGVDPVVRYDGSLYIDTSCLSRGSLDVALVKACVTAALFPNVATLLPPDPTASLHRQRKQAQKVLLHTKYHKKIRPSKESPCRQTGRPRKSGIPSRHDLIHSLQQHTSGDLMSSAENAQRCSQPTAPAMLYVYQDVFRVQEAREEFLTTLSAVSIWALLLFGTSDFLVKYYPSLSVCVIDAWIGLRISEETYALITEVRQAMYNCVGKKYHYPNDAQNNRTLELVQQICTALLKAPIVSAASPSQDAELWSPTQAATQQLSDTGSIVDPLTFARSANFYTTSITSLKDQEDQNSWGSGESQYNEGDDGEETD